MFISQRQPSQSISRFAQAHSIPYQTVDGNNIFDVMTAAKKLITDCRQHSQPCLLEAFTYRKYGHVDFREDIDVGIERSAESIALWRKCDPILRLKNTLLSHSLLNQDELESIEYKIKSQLTEDWDRALSDPYPDPSTLLNYTYSQ